MFQKWAKFPENFINSMYDLKINESTEQFFDFLTSNEGKLANLRIGIDEILNPFENNRNIPKEKYLFFVWVQTFRMQCMYHTHIIFTPCDNDDNESSVVVDGYIVLFYTEHILFIGQYASIIIIGTCDKGETDKFDGWNAFMEHK